MSDQPIPTRERCDMCGTRGWGFYSPLWKAVAGWRKDSILCVQCFGKLGDERNICWLDGLEIHPSSLNRHHGLIESGEWAGSIRKWKERSSK